VKAKKQNLTINIPRDLRVQADPEMLVSVYSQLIANALQFTSAEGQITLDARELPGSNMIEARVKDDGVGMSEAQLENLFRVEKVRLHKKPQDSGTGLGLVLTRGFVRKHDGKIHVNSREGEGTEVIFTLPRAG
jgi:signal transduction histidine kinase